MARLRVREIAEQKGMNITDLQLQANRVTNARLTYATVHALWHNKTKRPDLDTLAAVARALEVEPGELIGSGDPKDDAQGITIPGQVAA